MTGNKKVLSVLSAALILGMMLFIFPVSAQEESSERTISITLPDRMVDLEFLLYTASNDNWDLVTNTMLPDLVPSNGTVYLVRLGVIGEPISEDTLQQIVDAVSLQGIGDGFKADFQKAVAGYSAQTPDLISAFDLLYCSYGEDYHGMEELEFACGDEVYSLQGLSNEGEVIALQEKDPAKEDKEALEDLYRQAIDEELPVLEGEPVFGGLLVVHVINKNESYSDSIMTLAEGGQFYNVPDSVLAARLSDADTAVIIYDEGEVIGQYAGTDIDAVRTYTKVIVIDLRTGSMYEPYTAATTDPPATTTITTPVSQVAGGSDPETALNQIMEKMGVEPVA